MYTDEYLVIEAEVVDLLLTDCYYCRTLTMANGKVSVQTQVDGEEVYHKVRGLPQFQQLSKHVKEIVSSSSYWDKYGADQVNIGMALPLYVVS